MNYYDKSYQDYAAGILREEITTISPPKEALVRVALIFPNTYEVGMSNLGFQEVYRLFNNQTEVLCERFFVNPPPFHTIFRSLESGRELRDFDVIAFSVSFEMDYPNIIHFLQQGQMKPLAANRSVRDPLIICGGIITMLNPAPLAPVIDCFLIGEAEKLVEKFIKILLHHKKTGFKSPACLEELATVSHHWVPALEKSPVKRSLKDSRKTPICSRIISPFTHFKNMFLIEVGRACARGCKFCAASHVYRPVKFFPPQTIINSVLNNPFETNKVGLVGSALSDYPHLTEVCQKLVAEKLELGLSSFRLDAIDAQFLEVLEQGGIRSLTLAPEAGSARLRNLIHKQLTDEQIFNTVNAISKSRITTLKFYFMIGLPFEQMPDIEAIIVLMQKITGMLTQRQKVTVSINAFIPKPMTPFQWSPMDSMKNLRQKRKFLINNFRQFKQLTVSFGNIKSEVLQGIFSLGDSKVGHHLVQALRKEGPGEFSLLEQRQLLEEYLYRQKSVTETMPWDFLMEPENRNRLKKRWEESIREADFQVMRPGKG